MSRSDHDLNLNYPNRRATGVVHTLWKSLLAATLGK